MNRRHILPASLAAALLTGCVDQPTTVVPVRPEPVLSTGAATSCPHRANATAALLMECVTVDAVRAHQAALQAIADANNGTRVSGSPGYDQSVDYVVTALQDAGYQVTRQPFQYQGFLVLAPTLLEQVAPGPVGPLPTIVFSYSGSGDVTAAVSLVQQLGCNAADFAGFPAGNIALISRGTCTFAIKATNAYNAGASAVVIYNNVAGDLNGTLGNTFTLHLPVVATTQSAGQQLAATPGLVLRVRTQTFAGTITSENVLAESSSGNPDNVVMVGAHLDAVNAGPGINDNGSGAGAVLETAIQLARTNLANKVRFAFWGAEEFGLVGSTHYVNSLAQGDLARIALYLNFDVIGSPNHGFFVYDGDDSDGIGAGPGPGGSGEVEAVFHAFYAGVGQSAEGTDLSGTSDYVPFMSAGIPVGGVFSGASGTKSPAQAAKWGGTAGVAFDPCYHLACDTFDNVSLTALDVNSDAVAYATHAFAMSTERVNGIKGRGTGKAKGIFKPTGSTVGAQSVGTPDR